MTFLAILRILLPPFDQLGIAGILFQQFVMLANRYLVIMDIDDLVQLTEAVNPVGHQQDDMALKAFQVSQNLLFSCRVNGRKWVI